MATVQATQKETKTEKCTCEKSLEELKKEVLKLKAEITVIKAVLKSGR